MKKMLVAGNHDNLGFPVCDDDAGMDLFVESDTWIHPKEIVKVRHNIQIALPKGTFGYIMPRSSTITQNWGELVVMSSPIDSGYRGEVFSMVKNTGNESVLIRKNERISQLVILPFITVHRKHVTSLPESERGKKGFGSSGK